MTSTVTIENDRWRIGLLPGLGGAVATGEVTIGGQRQHLLRPTPADAVIPNRTASYPLVPWSNRIRDGLLRFNGREYQLRRNWPDGTAIHGAGWDYPWNVTAHSDSAATLEFMSHDVYGVNWPWSFTAAFTYALDGDTFRWTYALTNTSHETFPAGFGHHPYFLRSVAGSADAHLQLDVERAYDLVDCMATGEAGPIRAAADFRTARELGTEFVDDCFTGRTGDHLATVEWPGAVRIDITADALLEHAVLYIPPGRDFFALEPVSNANDAFNLDEDGVPGTGLFLLQPGETRTASFAMTATDLT
ncbi:aldose 1-epimerase [Demequina sp. B12]|uniref:aldose 1-epimerase n=1 Tax=Demequina sp. B12 TaxID=2992757 RepID=UPI00237BAFE4|nr:aldose 1-epimerase [Demequina sp. B12]MDE0572194.1 aldose 1-epimerase [Demequina sp. B12]